MRRWLAALVTAIVSVGAPGQDFGKVEIAATRLSDTVYMLTGAGGNLGLSVGADAVFLIDDQYAPLTPKIKEAIARLTNRPVQFVLNTHWHGDHTGGNENFAKDGTLVVAHDNVRKRMGSEQLIAFLGMKQPPSPKGALPVITFSGDVTFHINGDEVHAFHVPNAHTDGDAIIHFRRSDVIHMGDVYFNGFYPFIDVDSGGSADGVIAAVDRVLALATEKTRIIPGHGPLAARSDLQAYRDLLATVARRIRDLRAAGKSDDEIRAAKPTQEFDARYGGGFFKPDRWIDLMLKTVK